MDILVWNGKHDPYMWDASTPEKRAAAYLALFNELKDFGAYYEYEEDEEDPDFDTGVGTVKLGSSWERRREAAMRADYALADAGDGAAAERLCKARSDYEYEFCYISTLIDPLAP